MALAPFSVAVEPAADVSIVRLGGTIDRNASVALEEAFGAACVTGAARVLFDFDHVEYLNSTGIALIVGVLNQARLGGIDLGAWGLTPHFREIFEITRIVEYMPIYENQSSALDG